MSRTEDQSPDPSMHIKTLMRIGYTLDSAVSDIIDNSITAKCRNINIWVPPGLKEPHISIVDDGVGMSPEELIQNMRIGCKNPNADRPKGDLGRFGSGMKTASFSQARELTVITKKRGFPLVAARWDIDRIEETNSWCLEIFEGEEINEIDGVGVTEEMDQGTQIIWRNLTCFDRGSHALDHDTEVTAHLSTLKAYLAQHFHRFMESGRQNKLNIFLNKSLIEPIDPFLSTSQGYQEGRTEKLRCKGGHIVIKTHVLPHFNRMSTAELERMGGTEGITQNQGLYIYREERLINAGGWFGLTNTSPLGALARVQVDVPSAIDNDWSTDVKKSSLNLPSRIRRELKKYLADPIKKSKRVYKYRGKTDVANRYWKITEDENERKITYQFDPENDQLLKLLSTCDRETTTDIVRYLGELSATLPIHHIYEKMSEAPKDIVQQPISEKLMDEILSNILRG